MVVLNGTSKATQQVEGHGDAGTGANLFILASPSPR